MTHNSIDVEVLDRGGASEQVHDAVIARRATTFAYVGQLIERKNVQAILHALANGDLSHTLKIVGEGPLDRELREAVLQLGIGDRVDFVGYVEPVDLGALLSTASTLILPSTDEVYGLVPVEALALGLQAIVSSAVGVAADISGMDGVWVVEPTPDAIRDAMGSASVAWRGPIAEPAVREWTADQFAADVMNAVEIAGRQHRRVRR